MKRKIVSFVVRAVGVLGGALGISMIYGICHLRFASDEINPVFLYTFMVGIPLLIALFFIWVAYLVLFRFSPGAVQQVCGVLGFILLGYMVTAISQAKLQDALWLPLLFLGALAVVFFGYRALARYLNRIIFPSEQNERVNLQLP